MKLKVSAALLMKLKVSAALLLLLLTGCVGPAARSYRNHVSDVENEDGVKGITYDKGPAHPTFWEMVFARLGVK